MKLLFKTKIDFLETFLLLGDVLLVLIVIEIILFKPVFYKVEEITFFENELIKLGVKTVRDNI